MTAYLFTFAPKSNDMTYRELITRVAFDNAWAVLCTYYQESEMLKENYLHLYETLKTLPETNATDNAPIRFLRGYKEKIKVENILYPQEELIDKTIESNKLVPKLSEAELLGHILYWSTMYGFMTAKQHAEDFQRLAQWTRTGNPYEISVSRLRRRTQYRTLSNTVATRKQADIRRIRPLIRSKSCGQFETIARTNKEYRYCDNLFLAIPLQSR